ncbi:hypothetical protein [Arthrobacter sp. VKM Ac-2550]|uniref:hypothetical protein n=1 Tax=Crystallibacter permensis TaxID=1938888 RepID=UPI00222763FF|nr:hypothetical protein [Arthrobacter sp. VKM Ac-2550]MCW2134981.1 hypothetical protein [Arthrobacter sp. VKM Ac-2550]
MQQSKPNTAPSNPSGDRGPSKPGIPATVAIATVVTLLLAWAVLELTHPGPVFICIASAVIAVCGKGAQMFSTARPYSPASAGLARFGEGAIFLGWVGIAVGAAVVLA